MVSSKNFKYKKWAEKINPPQHLTKNLFKLLNENVNTVTIKSVTLFHIYTLHRALCMPVFRRSTMKVPTF